MNHLFNIDSPVMSFLSRMADIIILNILYIICCLPIFTIGAASSALYYQVMKMSKNEESYVFRGFFKAFKENFRKATIAWMILLVIGIMICIDLIISSSFSSSVVIKCFRLLCYFALVIWMIAFSYTFPLFSKFENTVKNTMKNAVLMGIRHLPYTISIIILDLSPILVVLLLSQFLQFEVLLMTMCWFSVAAYLNGILFHKIFSNYIPAEVSEDDGSEITDSEDTEEANE